MFIIYYIMYYIIYYGILSTTTHHHHIEGILMYIVHNVKYDFVEYIIFNRQYFIQCATISIPLVGKGQQHHHHYHHHHHHHHKHTLSGRAHSYSIANNRIPTQS